MPGSIRVSDVQPPVAAPLFLQVNLGKKEYSGYIGQDGFSFPVTSLRDSMVLSLYDADKELVSKTEVKTRSIVELGSTDVVFNLDSGGEIILQLQFLLSDEDRKRIREMRNSAMKRKQQELFGNGDELYFQADNTPPKEQAAEISDIPSKEDRLTLRKSMSTDDLKRRAVFSEISIGTNTEAPKNPPLQSSTSEGPIDIKGLLPKSDIGSKRGQGEPESRSSSAVKKMISAFESSSPQGPPSVPRIKSEGSLEGMLSASTNTSNKSSGKVTVTSGDIGLESRSGRRATTIISNKKPSASRQADLLNAQESRRGSSSRRDRAVKTSMGENAKKQNHHRRSIAPMRSGVTSSIAWTGHPHICITTASRQLKDLVGLEHLNSMKNVERSAREEDAEQGTSNDDVVGAKRRRSDGFPALNGWLINQGVRGVIVIIACGAVFLNNR